MESANECTLSLETSEESQQFEQGMLEILFLRSTTLEKYTLSCHYERFDIIKQRIRSHVQYIGYLFANIIFFLQSFFDELNGIWNAILFKKI